MITRHSPQRRRQSGFTLLEVMMALTVLGIGMLGIVALQTSTIGATQDAQSFTVANTVARTWVERLQRDAQRWNHPSTFSSATDLGTTAWLQNVTAIPNQWFRPAMVPLLEPTASPAFDRLGRDISLADTVMMQNENIYCTHLRLRQLYPTLIKAEIRVFWKKRRMANYATYSTYGLTGGLCSTVGNEAALGKDDQNFHWNYVVTGIAQSRAQ